MRVGLDIGGTKMLGVVVAADGAVVAQAREATVAGPDGVLATATRVLDRLPAPRGGGAAAAGPDGVLATATRVLDRLAAEFDGVLPSHVGIGFPGLVDHDRGAVSHAVNLGLGGDWLPLADRLAERT